MPGAEIDWKHRVSVLGEAWHAVLDRSLAKLANSGRPRPLRAIVRCGNRSARIHRKSYRHSWQGNQGNPVLRISAHSTRIGAAQDLTAAGAALPEIMVAGGWKNPPTPANTLASSIRAKAPSAGGSKPPVNTILADRCVT